MSPKRRKFDVTTEREAIMAISAGVTFFAIKKPIKTVLVLLLMGFGPAYVAFDYFTSYRATVKEAQPIAQPTSFRTVNDYQDDKILIDGKLYGYKSERYEAWVLKDAPVILIHDRKTGTVAKIDLPGLKSLK